MFMHGMREWGEIRDREQLMMFRGLGVDPEDIRRKGFEGVQALVQEMMTCKDKSAEIEKFLDSHPELKALMDAQCRESEAAALRLLGRDDAGSLLLAPAEIEPWFPAFEKQIAESPGVLEAMQQNAELEESAQKALADLMYSTCSKMAANIERRP